MLARKPWPRDGGAPPMLRLVLDTNVVISGLIWQGKPRHLVQALLDDRYTAYTSYTLISELTRKLLSTKLGHELLKRDISAEHLVQSYSALCEVISPAPLALRTSRDPDDDQVLSCAKAAQADLLVTGDQDLLVLQQFEGVAIVSVAQALERLGFD
jgi:uncharacterized protein